MMFGRLKLKELQKIDNKSKSFDRSLKRLSFVEDYKRLHYKLPEGDECKICFQIIQIRGKLSSCNHLFCFNCMEKWFFRKANEIQPVCPICNQTFSILSRKELITENKLTQMIKRRLTDDVLFYIDFATEKSSIIENEDSLSKTLDKGLVSQLSLHKKIQKPTRDICEDSPFIQKNEREKTKPKEVIKKDHIK